jgi:hypothetical protein
MDELIQQKLSQLRQKYIGSDDSQAYVNDLEKEITNLFEEKRMAVNPIFQAIFKDAEKKLNDINLFLQNDEKLTDIDRRILFAQKNIWKFVFERFGLKLHDNAIALLKEIIDSKLAQ